MTSKRRRRIWLLIALVIVAVAVWRFRGGPTIKSGTYLRLPISGVYADEPPTDLFGALFREAPHNLLDFVEALRIAALDDRIAGAIAVIGPLEIGWAKTEDLRGALSSFRASGKALYAVLENEVGACNQEYFLASAAERVYLSPASTAPLIGLAAQATFLGGVWEKIDVDMYVDKIKEYKTAGDSLVNKEMSPYQREMTNSLLDSVNARFVGAIAKARSLDESAVQAFIDGGNTTGPALQQAKLLDGMKYGADVAREDAGDAPLVDLEDYHVIAGGKLGRVANHTIAVIYGVGPIVVGESTDSAVQGQVMGSTTIIEAIEDAAESSDAKAIVFRVDSPGGSALASDLIWKATQEAKAKKPVIVSMSDVAGSGGYYVAAGASRILAQPTTLTGSIGIVFARPNIEGLLNRLGINTQTVTRGAYANLNSVTEPLDSGAKARIHTELEYLYGEFVQRVSSGRNMTAEAVNEVGRGRVWTGAQASTNGLVDEIGGFAEAIAAAKRAASIGPEDEVELVFYPRHKTFAERIAEALTTRISTTAARLPGVEEWRILASALPFMEAGALAVMPERIRIQ